MESKTVIVISRYRDEESEYTIRGILNLETGQVSEMLCSPYIPSRLLGFFADDIHHHLFDYKSKK